MEIFYMYCALFYIHFPKYMFGIFENVGISPRIEMNTSWPPCMRHSAPNPLASSEDVNL